MDLKCPVCREPWDFDSLHEVEGKSFEEAYSDFRKEGCKVFGSTHGELMSPGEQNMYSELYDVLGDDADGMAAMMEDFGL